MDNPISINFPIITPTIEALLIALLQQDEVSITQAGREKKSDFVTLKEGAKIADVNYFTFRKWVVAEGKIPYSRPSGAVKGKVKVRRSDIDRLLAGKTRQPGVPGRKTRKISIL